MDSTVFAEVELSHHWPLQPPLAAYRDIHRSISLCSWCHASLSEEYAGNSLLRAFLTATDGTHVYWRSNGDGGMEPCSSTAYGRVCRRCEHPAGDGVLCASSLSEKQCSKRYSSLTKLNVTDTTQLEPINPHSDYTVALIVSKI